MKKLLLFPFIALLTIGYTCCLIGMALFASGVAFLVRMGE